MSRSKERRRHKRLARALVLKETNPDAFTRKGARVFDEAIGEAAYRLKLLVEGNADEARERLGWRSFEDLLGRTEVYGLKEELQSAIAELTARLLCRPMAGRPMRRRSPKVIWKPA